VKKEGENSLHPIVISPHRLRLIDAAVSIAAGDDDLKIAYHHMVFCQTVLPYRHVDDRVWKCTNGSLSLAIEAGMVLDPKTQQWINLPLPFGPKARLFQIYLDTQAKLLDTPIIELEGSMTSFIKKLQGNSPNGRELRNFKTQAAAMASALFHFSTVKEGRTSQIDAKIISNFELWYPKDERQLMLFPSMVRLSDEYFSSLRQNAVPLNYRAVAAMQHNALMLDIYKWLAHRLFRVPAGNPTSIPWPFLHTQFGHGYTRIRDFRRDFIVALKTVLTEYPGARVEVDQTKVKLYHSKPPILPKEPKPIV